MVVVADIVGDVLKFRVALGELYSKWHRVLDRGLLFKKYSGIRGSYQPWSAGRVGVGPENPAPEITGAAALKACAGGP